jgi:hypothetical protein
MMIAAFLITVTFENQVPVATQQAIAQQTPFLSVQTNGNLVVSLGNFLLATAIADLVLFVPLFLLGRRDR